MRRGRPAALAFTADRTQLVRGLSGQDVGVSGVGVAPPQIPLQAAGQHGVIGWYNPPIMKLSSGPN